MTTLTPDERAREALAIRIFNAPAGPDGRTVGGVLDIGAYGHAMDMCRQIAEIVHREECSIITAETPSPDEREGMAEALKFTAAYRDVETAARALVERIAGQLHVGPLNWDREFFALKAALAATEGGDATETHNGAIHTKPETSPGASAAPLAPGEEAELVEIAEAIDQAFFNPPPEFPLRPFGRASERERERAFRMARAILPKIEQARAEERELVGEVGWLIETGDHQYWNGKHANADGFTHDANDAVRFSRLEDSERIINWLMEKHRVFLASRQHKWIGGFSQGAATIRQRGAAK